ncbi:MAG TPA: DUF2452 domain-containing protein [Flavobacteriales bacterium]|jgi:ribosome biogenesis SPOUT family RNA methylase Rps3|nr:DUF2452 domain-containing protein [Flavobacteriales bacterium]
MQQKKPLNPIDPEKITEKPSSLPYAHTVGGVPIKPIDQGRTKGRAMMAMYEQTDRQLGQIHKQIQLLAEQAKAIQERKELSEKIYEAEIPFKPLMGETYHLYEKDEKYRLSLIAPNEWGKNPPYRFVNSLQLLADHTWQVLDEEI